MILQSLVLKNFRNHRSTALEFPAQFNAFIGDNGQGKTSILEAIAYLCLTKSFTAQNDITVVTLGEEEFRVAGEFRSDLGAPSSVEIRYRRAEGKKTLQMNRTPVDSFASFIGIHPAVVLASDHEQITLGLPSARRRFLDVLLSQARRVRTSRTSSHTAEHCGTGTGSCLTCASGAQSGRSFSSRGTSS